MISPHFSTFPEAGLRFLRQLKRNNNREWFLAHKTAYEDSVKKPMEELVAALAVEFPRFAPEVLASPRTSLYRINRDTRFSKNKNPYKTHVAAVFPVSSLGKHEGASFYFHISTDELLIGGGLYMPLPDDLRAVRERIAAKHSQWVAILNEPHFVRLFGEISGQRLARVPRGFPTDHKAADDLRLKQFLAARVLPAESVTARSFFKALVQAFEVASPLVQFLNAPLLERRRENARKESFLL